MESIIEFIFDNIFFVLIILFGLFNLLGRSKPDQNQEGNKPQRRPMPGQKGETATQRREIPQQRAERKVEHKPIQTRLEEVLTQSEVDSTTIEDQRHEQFERLRRQYETSHTLEDLERAEDFTSNLEQSEIFSELIPRVQNKEIKMNLNQRLTQKGLIESVIMAEVLGPPKARQRFSNRYNQR